MADVVIDGYIRVSSVPSIANLAAPTTAELNAGVSYELLLTQDGLTGFESTTNWVNNAALGSTFDTNLPGTVSYSDMGLTFKWQTGTDTIFSTLVYGYATNIVIRRRVLRATAWTAAQLAEVYPVTCGQYTPLNFERNSLTRFRVPIGLVAEPQLRAVVA
jgi:hypothetical protein